MTTVLAGFLTLHFTDYTFPFYNKQWLHTVCKQTVKYHLVFTVAGTAAVFHRIPFYKTNEH